MLATGPTAVVMINIKFGSKLCQLWGGRGHGELIFQAQETSGNVMNTPFLGAFLQLRIQWPSLFTAVDLGQHMVRVWLVH